MKVSKLNNVQQFLDKLNKANFTEIKDKKLIGKVLGNDIVVGYNIEIDGSLIGNEFPIQVVLHVRINGEYAATWGCIDNAENAKVLRWFCKIKIQIRESERELENRKRQIAQELIDIL